MTAGVVTGAVILLAMAGVSCYGWVTLPSGARVPVHFGPGSYNNFLPKRYGLVIHPAIGAVVYVVIVTRLGASASGSGKAPLGVILPIIMGVLLLTQAGAVLVARRRAGGP